MLKGHTFDYGDLPVVTIASEATRYPRGPQYHRNKAIDGKTPKITSSVGEAGILYSCDDHSLKKQQSLVKFKRGQCQPAAFLAQRHLPVVEGSSKGLSIYYVIWDGGGSSRFITILHRGGN